jgi:hypothetical protein
VTNLLAGERGREVRRNAIDLSLPIREPHLQAEAKQPNIQNFGETMRKLNLGVLESRWEGDQNMAVKPIFDLISLTHCKTRKGYVYERFVSANSFTASAKFLLSQPSIRYLYVTAHGTKTSVICANDDRLNRARLKKNILSSRPGRTLRLRGLLIGSCEFMHEANAAFLLHGKPPLKSLCWVAGYDKRVNWIASSLLDSLFFHVYFADLRYVNGSERQRIERVAKKLSRQVPGLIDDLSFRLFVRKRRAQGDVENLL